MLHFFMAEDTITKFTDKSETEGLMFLIYKSFTSKKKFQEKNKQRISIVNSQKTINGQ